MDAPRGRETREYDALDLREFEAWITTAMAAWNAKNVGAIVRMCAPDVEWIDPALSAPVRGSAQLARFARWLFAVVPDGQFQPAGSPGLTRDATTAFQPWHWTGTNDGPIDPPGFAATHRAIDMLGVDRYRFRDGLLAEYRCFYDRAELMVQLGLLPEPGSRHERALVRLHRIGRYLHR